MSCFASECSKEVKTCMSTDKHCDERMSCLQDTNGSREAGDCMAGLTFLDMSVNEIGLMGCGRKKGCIKFDEAANKELRSFTKNPKSFLEAKAKYWLLSPRLRALRLTAAAICVLIKK